MSRDAEKLLGLLGLARRAGKLAMGFNAVEQLVRRGRRPLVILATDLGPSQKNKAMGWQDDAVLFADALSKEELARTLGREKLGVVGTSDPGFRKGLRAALTAFAEAKQEPEPEGSGDSTG